MRLQRQKKLKLQKLEARDNPSISLFYTPRELVITGIPNGVLEVNHVAPFENSFEVLDDGISYGKYIVNNLRIRTPHRPDDLVIDLNSQMGNPGRIPGNVELDLGLGFTTISKQYVSILDTGTPGNGEISGRLRILNGNGSEELLIGIDRTIPTPFFEPINVGQGIFVKGRNVAQPALSGTSLSIGNGTNVAGPVVTSDIQVVNVGFPEVGGMVATVSGSVIQNNANSGTGTTLFIAGVVGGDAVTIGNHREDNFSLNITAVGVGGIVNGNVVFIGGSSTTGNFATFNVGTTINGDVTVISGPSTLAPDGMFLLGTINGNVNLHLGNGDNSVFFAGTVNGNMNINGGNQNDTYLFLGGSIAGDVQINAGNGTNSLTFSAQVNGSRFNYTGGNGSNTLTYSALAGSAPFLSVNFGSGTNTLSLSNQNFSKLSVQALPFSVNTFTVPFTFTVPVTLVNFPSS